MTGNDFKDLFSTRTISPLARELTLFRKGCTKPGRWSSRTIKAIEVKGSDDEKVFILDTSKAAKRSVRDIIETGIIADDGTSRYVITDHEATVSVCSLLMLKAKVTGPSELEEKTSHIRREFRDDEELQGQLIPIRIERLSSRGNLIVRELGALDKGTYRGIWTVQLEWTRSDFWRTHFEVDGNCTVICSGRRYRCIKVWFRTFPKYVMLQLERIG